MTNLTKISAWATAIGISRQSAYEAIERCQIPVTDGKVDPVVAGVLYKERTRARAKAKNGAIPAGADGAFPAGAAPDGKQSASAYDASRTRRETAEAEISEMKLAEMQGKFLLKSEVEDAVFEIARALRDGLTNSALRIAADVASMSTARECEQVIDREHRSLLESMSHSLAATLKIDVTAVEADN